MSLIFRMLYVWLLSLSKPRLPIGRSTSVLHLISLPNDLDINLHVNNGRFLTLCDLNRVDLFIRTGLFALMRKEKWIPIIAEHTMQYKKPLKVFTRFRAVMELVDWDDKYFNMQHKFFIGDNLIAEGTSKGVIRGKSGVVVPKDVICALEKFRHQKAIDV